jgi:ATP-independent RNA helicase DbpA
MNDAFTSLTLEKSFTDNLKDLGYTAMTPIQSQALPPILAGRDVIAQAKTGSGKTAAFGIGVVTAIDTRKFDIQAIILCPTRELADQVGKELRRLARTTPNVKLLSLCGGVPMRPQLASLEFGAHIVVGTPGRIQAHLDKGSLRLERLKILVLDEADRMLDMGFYDDIKKIIDTLPPKRQTLLFSATFPDSVREISRTFQHDPLEVSAKGEHDQSVIRQIFLETTEREKMKALLRLLDHYQPENAIVFCNTKVACTEVSEYLNAAGFHALDIHGDLEQRERNETLVQFANGSCSILVATDVAARGLDVKELQAVISYDIAHDPEVHIHRIGRTGRAGKEGLALALLTPADGKKLDAINDYLKSDLTPLPWDTLETDGRFEHRPPMVTICIDGGRKQKMRPGDILGALTKDAGLPGDAVGKIDIFDFQAYVAIRRNEADRALEELRNGKIKGRSFRVWKL